MSGCALALTLQTNKETEGEFCLLFTPAFCQPWFKVKCAGWKEAGSQYKIKGEKKKKREASKTYRSCLSQDFNEHTLKN